VLQDTSPASQDCYGVINVIASYVERSAWPIRKDGIQVAIKAPCPVADDTASDHHLWCPIERVSDSKLTLFQDATKDP